MIIKLVLLVNLIFILKIIVSKKVRVNQFAAMELKLNTKNVMIITHKTMMDAIPNAIFKIIFLVVLLSNIYHTPEFQFVNIINRYLLVFLQSSSMKILTLSVSISTFNRRSSGSGTNKQSKNLSRMSRL